MFAGIRKRLARKQNEKDCDEDDKDDGLDSMPPPPNYIQISQGRIQLVHQPRTPVESEAGTLSLERHGGSTSASGGCDKDVLEKRMIEVEGALLRLQEQFQKTRFARQESLLQSMQQENRSLLTRIRQYEHCLDDVMRKVVDAIVAEDNLREEVSMLKGRVRDLEAQNAALSASPMKGRDEGYCTMSSGQPQPSNGHLEDLPEEPEQWLLPAEPCSTEMEDWSMSQEELAVMTFEDERDQQHHHLQHPQQQQRRKRDHDWLWPSSDFINSTTVETDSVADGIAQLLQQKIVYSEDEEVACTDFTNDFYKLVNIRSNSSRSLYSYLEGETDDEDEDDDDGEDSSMSESQVGPAGRTAGVSPTPSEAGRAQLTSCSSSETDDLSASQAKKDEEPDYAVIDECRRRVSDIEIEDVPMIVGSTPMKPLDEQQCIAQIIKSELRRPPHALVKSKSVLEEQEPSCILRHNQRRELESTVVRSDSISCAMMTKMAKEAVPPAPGMVTKLKERMLLRQASTPPTASPWRRSNGWKRVTSPVHAPAAVSPKKKEAKSTEPPKSCLSKAQPTRIPTSIHSSVSSSSSMSSSCSPSPSSPSPQSPQQRSPGQQAQQQRKSKIPPPVPVRRSYAS
ncbi:uncharacterized protein LOC108029610 isoform X3 [Drosophila biarmipes]|uniref:uncharacterized protein LOC108029610 isoform X3 n=1 Tax=Drosophila biarmipes TaxID=125945 RepID=UPI0007E6E08D|nr:uncharacterized protein LOC108029610 isoform X3 [Drosophila biarmipes]